MATVNESVWLNAKPEDVWPFIVEPEKKLQWLTELHRHVWIDEGPAGVGTRFYVEIHYRTLFTKRSSESADLADGADTVQ